MKNNISKDEKQIIEIEFENYKNFAQNNTLVFNYISNESLKNRLNNSAELSNYFSKRGIDSILIKLQSKLDKKNEFDLPKNFILKNDTALDVDKTLSVKRVNISSPLIVENNEMALLAFSFGYENSLEGGIRIYYRNNGKWKYYETFDLWIE